jgi:hypothetical protein
MNRFRSSQLSERLLKAGRTICKSSSPPMITSTPMSRRRLSGPPQSALTGPPLALAKGSEAVAIQNN